jgi:hypothetical protein
MKTRVHVNMHNIRANLKDGGDRPVVSARTYKGTRQGHEVVIDGPSKVVYPGKQLGCGARVWIETTAPVKVLDRDGEEVD